MKLVKLNAINSTNSFLKEFVKENSVENWTVVVAEDQTAGKGQLQNKWQSETGKNLTFSVLCEPKNVEAEQFFYLNYVVSLAIFHVLYKLIPEGLKVKWPNDIMSGSKKICGILIENTVSQNRIVRTIIGIGLNVNQEKFKNLPNATSLKMITGKTFDKEKILIDIVNELKEKLLFLERRDFGQIKTLYESHLYKKDVPAMFQDASKIKFLGKIQGVDNAGKLVVILDDESLRTFAFKEISFL